MGVDMRKKSLGREVGHGQSAVVVLIYWVMWRKSHPTHCIGGLTELATARGIAKIGRSENE